MKKYQMINTANHEIECEFTREEFEDDPARFTSEEGDIIDSAIFAHGYEYAKGDDLDWLIENIYTGTNCDRLIKEVEE